MGGRGDFVVRGGSGLYYGTIVSNISFSEQSFGNRIVANSFTNDGLPGWILDPTRNFTAEQIRTGATPQAPRAIAHDFQFPRTWQSSIGVQRRVGDRLGTGPGPDALEGIQPRARTRHQPRSGSPNRVPSAGSHG